MVGSPWGWDVATDETINMNREYAYAVGAS